MSFACRACALPLLAAGLCTTHPVSAATLGLALDRVTHTATVFDADSDRVRGSVLIAPAVQLGDCVITADQSRGFVSSRSGAISVIDLSAVPPRLADGPNPIPIANPGGDTTISEDGRYLLSCGGTSLISIVDIASQHEVGIFDLGASCEAVEACADGSVLVESQRQVRRLRLDASGGLSDTGERIAGYNPFCAGRSVGLALSNALVRTFTIPGLQRVSEGELRAIDGSSSGKAFSGQANRAGNRVYAFSTLGRDPYDVGFVDVFALDPASGRLNGESPIYTYFIGIERESSPLVGVDRLALSPYGDKLYAASDLDFANDERTDVLAAPRLNAQSLTLPIPLAPTPIRYRNFSQPSGICLPTRPAPGRVLPVLKALGKPVGFIDPDRVQVTPLARLEIPGQSPLRLQRLSGRTLEFTASSGEWICRGRTDAAGYATCTGVVSLERYGGVPGFEQARYEARFLGDRGLEAASASARLVFPKFAASP